jgi:hypothetical protein
VAVKKGAARRLSRNRMSVRVLPKGVRPAAAATPSELAPPCHLRAAGALICTLSTWQPLLAPLGGAGHDVHQLQVRHSACSVHMHRHSICKLEPTCRTVPATGRLLTATTGRPQHTRLGWQRRRRRPPPQGKAQILIQVQSRAGWGSSTCQRDLRHLREGEAAQFASQQPVAVADYRPHCAFVRPHTVISHSEKEQGSGTSSTAWPGWSHMRGVNSYITGGSEVAQRSSTRSRNQGAAPERWDTQGLDNRLWPTRNAPRPAHLRHPRGRP